MKRILSLNLLLVCLFITSCDVGSFGDKGNNISFKNESLTVSRFNVCDLPIDTDADSDNITFTYSIEGIVKVEKGKLIPIKEGEVVVTASLKNGQESKMSITVIDDGYVPFIEVKKDSLNLFKNTQYSISPNTTLRGKDLDCAYTFSSLDSSIASVDENGNITALNAGKTEINVVASYYEFTGDKYYSLSKAIEVEVMPEVFITISTESNVINTRKDTINDISYTNESSLYGQIYYNGEYKNIFDESVTLCSSNTNILKIENKKIVALNPGSASVFASATIDGVKYTSNYLDIVVEKPTVLIDNDYIDIDIHDTCFSLDTSFMIQGDSNVDDIYDLDNRSQSIFNGTSLCDYEEIGPRKWVVESTKNNYVINVISCSKIIKTIDDLNKMNTYGKDIIKSTSGVISYDGYYILANDIDMDGARFKTFCGNSTGATSVTYNGFKGVFDGRYHTISNAVVSASDGGMFATMNKSSILKNVCFKNITVSGASGFISSNFAGTIENVYIEGKLTCNKATSNSPCSLLASKIYDGATISNCVINFTNANAAFNYSSAIGIIVSAKESCFDNVYVIGTNSKVFSTSVSGTYNKFSNIKNGQFDSYDDFLLNDLTRFNSHWKFNESGIKFSINEN